LRDGDNVVLAGVHTVYAGQRVKQARPLFDGEADGGVAEPAAALNAVTPINEAVTPIHEAATPINAAEAR